MSLLNSLPCQLRDFAHSTKANVAVIIAMTLPVIMLIMFFAIEYGNAMYYRLSVQRSLDAALLAGLVHANSVGEGSKLSTLQIATQETTNVFNANISKFSEKVRVNELRVVQSKRNVYTATANLTLPDTIVGRFMQSNVLANHQLRSSAALPGSFKGEIVFAINSGAEMADHLGSAQNFANAILDEVYESQDVKAGVNVSVVPFSYGVKPGDTSMAQKLIKNKIYVNGGKYPFSWQFDGCIGYNDNINGMFHDPNATGSWKLALETVRNPFVTYPGIYHTSWVERANGTQMPLPLGISNDPPHSISYPYFNNKLPYDYVPISSEGIPSQDWSGEGCAMSSCGLSELTTHTPQFSNGRCVSLIDYSSQGSEKAVFDFGAEFSNFRLGLWLGHLYENETLERFRWTAYDGSNRVVDSQDFTYRDLDYYGDNHPISIWVEGKWRNHPMLWKWFWQTRPSPRYRDGPDVRKDYHPVEWNHTGLLNLQFDKPVKRLEIAAMDNGQRNDNSCYQDLKGNNSDFAIFDMDVLPSCAITSSLFFADSRALVTSKLNQLTADGGPGLSTLGMAWAYYALTPRFTGHIPNSSTNTPESLPRQFNDDHKKIVFFISTAHPKTMNAEAVAADLSNLGGMRQICKKMNRELDIIIYGIFFGEEPDPLVDSAFTMSCKSYYESSQRYYHNPSSTQIRNIGGEIKEMLGDLGTGDNKIVVIE